MLITLIEFYFDYFYCNYFDFASLWYELYILKIFNNSNPYRPSNFSSNSNYLANYLSYDSVFSYVIISELLPHLINHNKNYSKIIERNQENPDDELNKIGIKKVIDQELDDSFEIFESLSQKLVIFSIIFEWRAYQKSGFTVDLAIKSWDTKRIEFYKTYIADLGLQNITGLEIRMFLNPLWFIVYI